VGRRAPVAVFTHDEKVIAIISIAIVDDDPRMLAELSRKVSDYVDERRLRASLHLFSGGAELLRCARRFDLVFLDIQMDEISGMDAAKRLRENGTTGHIIFVTVFDEYVYEAFEVEASDYLLKPIDSARFERTMDRVCRSLRKTKEPGLVIPSRGNNFSFLRFSDILYCEAKNHKMIIRCKTATLECSLKIDELKGRLDDRFFQCHRSYFINLHYACGYEAGLVALENGEKIPVSRLRAREFSRRMLQHIKERTE
jgi:DNA-binding LytR/AlgR family response regulator